jgi:DNA invertase Pin-like site-specific DNA recombinase
MTRMEPTKLAAYIRVSTAAQAESGIGLSSQRKAINEASRVQGFVVASWHQDAGRSGASLRRRPGLQAALHEVAAGRVGGIVCAKIDRLGRSSADVTSLVERACREGWRLVALDVGLDSTTASGELVATALAMAARFEWRRISERQSEKHAELRRLGRPRGRLSVDRSLADRIVRERDEGATWAAIANRLNTDAVPTARGGREWRASSTRSAYKTRRAELDAQAPAPSP